jgi:hypothetical protein
VTTSAPFTAISSRAGREALSLALEAISAIDRSPEADTRGKPEPVVVALGSDADVEAAVGAGEVVSGVDDIGVADGEGRLAPCGAAPAAFERAMRSLAPAQSSDAAKK